MKIINRLLVYITPSANRARKSPHRRRRLHSSSKSIYISRETLNRFHYRSARFSLRFPLLRSPSAPLPVARITTLPRNSCF
ncbi:hypothetical protein M5689_022831 [Euphorbia peplus]|nr:hypothetical protein M5689_022831 [Euphorbia peplus]